MTFNWDPSEFPDWGAAVLIGCGGWRRVVLDGSTVRYEIRGLCPRCSSADGIDAWVPGSTAVLTAMSLSAGRDGALDALLAAADQVTIECVTQLDVEGRPKDLRGCGAWGAVPLLSAS